MGIYKTEYKCSRCKNVVASIEPPDGGILIAPCALCLKEYHQKGVEFAEAQAKKEAGMSPEDLQDRKNLQTIQTLLRNRGDAHLAEWVTLKLAEQVMQTLPKE